MPRNGSGTYTLPAGNPVVTGTTISSTVQNNTMSDVAVALTNSISKDGQTTPTANLTMGGFKLTNVGNATVATDAVNVTTAQNGAYLSLVSVSGTDTITAAASPTLTAYANGQRFSFIAAGTNTSTSVTLNIDGLGAKSITKLGSTALNIGDILSGQKVLVEYDGTRFQLISLANLLYAHGRCRLSYQSSTALILTPYNGNTIVVNGQVVTIPSAGVTVGAPGGTSTVFYIYAYISSGTLALEASTEVHVTDSTTGVEIKFGDATRTLVGMARSSVVPNQWQQTTSYKSVLSYFNRVENVVSVAAGSTLTTTSTSYAELSAGVRCQWLTWADEPVKFTVNGSCINSSTFITRTSIGVDGTTPQDVMASMTGTEYSNLGISHANTFSEGYHYSTVLGRVSGGTGTWLGSASTGERTTHQAIVMG